MNSRRRLLKTSMAAGAAFSILPSALRGETEADDAVTRAVLAEIRARQG